jgi:hypothetical protein
MLAEKFHVRARARIQHYEAYDFDESRGLWLRRLVFEEEVGNLVTNAGLVAIHTFIYGTAAQRTAASLGADGLSYIGLSNDAGAPAPGDTTLTGELSGNGLDRAAGTPTLPTGAGTITTISHDFTYSGGVAQGIQKTALFDASSGGNMAHEILFTQRILNTSDVITITFQITLA